MPWAQYYLGLGGVSVALMAAVWFSAFPFGLLPDVFWGAFVASVLLVSGVVHVYALRATRLGTSANPPEVETHPER